MIGSAIGAAVLGKLHVLEECPGGGDVGRGRLVDRLSGQSHRAGLRPQPRALALGARHLPAKGRERLLPGLVGRRGVFLFQEHHEPRKMLAVAAPEMFQGLGLEVGDGRGPTAAVGFGPGLQQLAILPQGRGAAPFQAAIAPPPARATDRGSAGPGRRPRGRPGPRTPGRRRRGC